MLTLEKYNRYERNIQDILDDGFNITTFEPINEPRLNDEMAITFDEHFTFQNAQARAHANGTISTEVAQIIYNSLGDVMSVNNGGWQKDVTLARKITITQMMSELLVRT